MATIDVRVRIPHRRLLRAIVWIARALKPVSRPAADRVLASVARFAYADLSADGGKTWERRSLDFAFSDDDNPVMATAGT